MDMIEDVEKTKYGMRRVEDERRVKDEKDNDDGSGRGAEVSTNSNGRGRRIGYDEDVEKRINAIVIKHLSDVLGANTLKVINFYLDRTGVDIHNICSNPKKVDDGLFLLFKEGAKMLVSEIISILYSEFNVCSNNDIREQCLEDAIELVKESIVESRQIK